MDFRKLDLKLSQPYWNTRPASNYVVPHPETGTLCGPGVWFTSVKPSDREIWNLAWGTMPNLDGPGGMTYSAAAEFVSNLPMLRRIGNYEVGLRGVYMLEKFRLVELSNLLSMQEFFPHLAKLKRTEAMPAWVRSGLLTRINAERAAA